MQLYQKLRPSNILAKYIPRLAQVQGTDVTSGLSPGFERDVAKAAASDVKWRCAHR